MRSKSIISYLRRNYKVRAIKSRIKYEDALEAMKVFENGTLGKPELIDNYYYPLKSISNHCQLDGCNQKIRYEWVLTNKFTGEKVVVGSTCVVVMLGLSDDLDSILWKIVHSIKDLHDMYEWKVDNMDVWNKIEELKAANLEWFKPFWEEVEFCRLHIEDEEFIRSLNIEDEIKKESDIATRRTRMRSIIASNNNPRPRASRKVVNPPVVSPPVVGRNAFENIISGIAYRDVAASVVLVSMPESSKVVSIESTVKNNSKLSGENDESYKKIVSALSVLVSKYPTNGTLISLKSQADSGIVLSDKQLKRVKIEINNEYFNNRIKGTPEEIIYNTCDGQIVKKFRELAKKSTFKMFACDMPNLNDDGKVVNVIKIYKQQFHDEIKNDDALKALWVYYRIKHEIIMR